MFVHLLTPRIGAPVELNRINVVLGANQSGKTALLRDVFRLATGREPGSDAEQSVKVEPVVLQDMQYGGSIRDEQLLQAHVGRAPSGGPGEAIEGLGGDLRGVCRAVIRPESWNIIKRPVLHARSVLDSELPEMMMLRTAFLDERTMDTAAAAGPACSPLEPARNLLQLLQQASDEVRDELDAAFAAAFPPLGLRLDDTQRVRLSLRISEQFPPRSGDGAANARLWDALPRLDEAGRGARNFAALAMSVLLLPGRIVLADDPDAALQPLAARQLGRWLASAVAERDCQLIVTARSPSLVAGLLERSKEVTLLRTRRDRDETRIGGASSDMVRDIVKSSLLNIDQALGALQRSGAILVERPQRAAALTALSGQRSGADRWDVLTVHRLSQAAPLLRLFRSIGLPAAVSSDLGAMQDKQVFSRLLDAACGNRTPGTWLATRDQLNRHVQALDPSAMRANTKAMEEMLEKLTAGEEAGDFDELEREDPWEQIRREGIAAIPVDQRPWIEQLLEELKTAGVFLSAHGEVGRHEELDEEEMERLMKAIRSGQTPDQLAVLLAEVIQYLRNPTRPAASIEHGALR